MSYPTTRGSRCFPFPFWKLSHHPFPHSFWVFLFIRMSRNGKFWRGVFFSFCGAAWLCLHRAHVCSAWFHTGMLQDKIPFYEQPSTGHPCRHFCDILAGLKEWPQKVKHPLSEPTNPGCRDCDSWRGWNSSTQHTTSECLLHRSSSRTKQINNTQAQPE